MNDIAVNDAAEKDVEAGSSTRVAVVEEERAPATTKDATEKDAAALEKPSGKAAAGAKRERTETDEGGGEQSTLGAWPPAWLRRAAVPLLVGVVVVCTGLAVFFGIAAAERRGVPAAANTALVDPAATAKASGELSDALVSIYSYDFARLDENEKAALAVATPAYAEKFRPVFGVIREQAPKLQAVMSAVVRKAAVQSIEGDRAVLVAFIDQRGTRVAEGGKADETTAAGRVEVIGQLVDGTWKVADVVVE